MEFGDTNCRTRLSSPPENAELDVEPKETARTAAGCEKLSDRAMLAEP